MRRQYFSWTYLVFALVLTIYGGYSIIYNLNHDNDIPILGIVFTVIGGTLFIIYFVLYLISLRQKKNNAVIENKVEVEENTSEDEEESEEEEIEETEVEEPVQKEKSTPTYRSDTEYRRTYFPKRENYGSAYIRKVGYGPVLRVEENEILDMRNNTYYRIEGNMVSRSGYGPVYEISGNRIRAAFGSYLYEISGDSVNKVYGGYYASISSGTIQTHDLKERYEISDSLSLKQKLAVVALLFGQY